MSRTLALLLALSLAPSLFAEIADVEVTVTGPEFTKVTEPFTAIGTVRNLGPDPALTVRVSMHVNFENICMENVDIGTLAPGESRTFECVGAIPQQNQHYRAVAILEARTQTQDPWPDNNVATHWVTAITPPDLFVFNNGAPWAAPELPVPITFSFGNFAEFAATGVRLEIHSPFGFARAPDTCVVDGPRAVCLVGSIEAASQSPNSGPRTLSFLVQTPNQSGALTEVRAAISGAEEDAASQNNVSLGYVQNYRTFVVTSLGDHAPGTLRTAIDNANADCADAVPCLISFRIPPGAQRWETIVPTSPLPRIRAERGVLIDGTTQTSYFGDSNPDGPEIEISGASLLEGNGLELGSPARAHVRGLTLNGFPGSALLFTAEITGPYSERIIEKNYIGTDPTGTKAVPNHRGVWLDMPGVRVEDNLISGNLYAGVFVVRGTVRIAGNRIGLDRNLQPLGNGASGVYIGTLGSGSDVVDNYIGFNGHFGIAIAGDATSVSAARNSVQGNAQHGIDWNLDGVITTNPVPLPEITSVRYEDGHTIIEGTSTGTGTFRPMVALYANDAPDPSGYGEGQYVLGEVSVSYEGSVPYHFTFVWPGDLRGKWVTATATRFFYNGWLRGVRSNADFGGVLSTTSEFSRAFAVK